MQHLWGACLCDAGHVFVRLPEHVCCQLLFLGGKFARASRLLRDSGSGTEQCALCRCSSYLCLPGAAYRLGASLLVFAAGALASGGALGAYMAKRMAITDLPQMVAGFHSLVGQRCSSLPGRPAQHLAGSNTCRQCRCFGKQQPASHLPGVPGAGWGPAATTCCMLCCAPCIDRPAPQCCMGPWWMRCSCADAAAAPLSLTQPI